MGLKETWKETLSLGELYKKSAVGLEPNLFHQTPLQTLMARPRVLSTWQTYGLLVHSTWDKACQSESAKQDVLPEVQ
jgi:hypothetical protein